MEERNIYPGENSEVFYWTRKWGISKAELYEAMLQTGSLRTNDLRNYLKRKKLQYSFAGILQFIKLRVSL
jgi:hypothetical protein